MANLSFYNDERFYSKTFLMNTLNVFSLISFELLFLFTFIDSKYSNFWLLFFLYNFFIFIWFGKKLINIFTNNVLDFDVKKSVRNYNLVKDEKYSLNYDKKYSLSTQAILIVFFVNFMIIILVDLLFKTTLLVNILVILMLIFIELFVYLMFIVASEETLSEIVVYKSLVKSLNYIFSQIVLIILGFIILKTNMILFGFYYLSSVSTISILYLIIFVTILTLIVKNHLFLFTWIIPLVLNVFGENPLIIGAFLSYSIYVYYMKNIIYFKSLSFNIIKEHIFVLVGGFVAFGIAMKSTLLFAYLFIIIYLLLLYFILIKKGRVND